MLATFASIQLYAPLANAAVNPFVPMVMTLATIAGVLGHVYAPLAIVGGAPLWLLVRGLRLVAATAAAAPGAVISATVPAVPAAAAWYTLLLAAPSTLRRLPKPPRRVGPRVRRPASLESALSVRVA